MQKTDGQSAQKAVDDMREGETLELTDVVDPKTGETVKDDFIILIDWITLPFALRSNKSQRKTCSIRAWVHLHVERERESERACLSGYSLSTFWILYVGKLAFYIDQIFESKAWY